MKEFALKPRRLWSSYRCHRHRGKTCYQILLELLAKGVSSPSASVRLMKRSLGRHGIGRDPHLAAVLWNGSASVPSVERGEIVTGRFFVDVRDERLWASYRSQFGYKIPAILADAEAICRHEFEFLGSGATCWGNPIDWHMDPVSGYRWPKTFFFDLWRRGCSPEGSDIKLPWELSRMQHLLTLGKAYRLTNTKRYAEEVVGQITHWLDDNPCPYGVNWTSAMDVAIRVMNVLWAYLLIEDSPTVTGDLRVRLATSLFQHGQFTLFNLEHSILNDGTITNGNHYLTDIVGLLHLGLLCPEYTTAETWRRVGVTALVEEMDHQVHPDGGDFESSIPYHRLALELFLAGALLCRLNWIALPEGFWKRLEKMFEFVLFVTRPDGKVPQVGDADDGRLYVLSDYATWDRTDFRYLLSIGAVLFQRSDMKAYAGEFSEEAFWLLGPAGMAAFAALEDKGEDLGSREFRDSGLYVMRASDRYLLACCGAVGTGGLGNHKHNDLLSFELYAGDKAFIVDPGAYVYTRNPKWRNLFRSTIYHNTVLIDEQEQNRFEASELFRMAADSLLCIHGWNISPERDCLDIEHTGYTRLSQPVAHRRIFLFEKILGRLEITDILTGDGDHSASWSLHFDHGIGLDPIGQAMFRTRSKGRNLVIHADAEIPLAFRIIDGWVSQRYGHKLPAKILHIKAKFHSTCRMILTIEMCQAVSSSLDQLHFDDPAQ